MATEDHTTTALVTGIKRRGSIPENQNLFTTPDLLAMADDEMRSNLYPMLMNLHAEYFVDKTDTPVSSGTDNEFSFPSTAISTKLRDVTIIDTNGGEFSIPQLSQDTVYDRDSGSRSTNPSQNLGFFIRGNKVKLYPKVPEGDYNLRLYFFRRPNRLVVTSAAGKITAIDSTLNIMTLSNVPAAWTTGDTICALDSKPSFNLKVETDTLVDVSAPTIEVADVSSYTIGDWVCLEGESTIPQIPVESHPILEQAVCTLALLALGDPKWKEHEAKLQQMRIAFQQMTSGRVEGEAKVIVDPVAIQNFTSYGYYRRNRNR